MRKLIVFLCLAVSTCAFSQQILDVTRGESRIFSWDEVVNDTSGKALNQEDIFYQIWAAPVIDGIANWMDAVSLLDVDFQPAVLDSGRIERAAPVELPERKYQIAVTAYIYHKLTSARLESERSAELIIFNMIEGKVPPSAPKRFKVEIPFK